MIRIFLLCCFLFGALSSVQAQIGIRAQIHAAQAPAWERMLSTHFPDESSPAFLNNGYSIGLDYWFRLKDYRIEFFPEIGYSALGTVQLDNNNYDWQQYFLKVHTHFYVFDFEEDCDCPTFSKQSPVFKKGFFFSLSLGTAWNHTDIFFPEVDLAQGLSFQGAIGAGLDIGLTDLITLTPHVQWNHWFNNSWDGISRGMETDRERISISAVNFGLRVGFRFPERRWY